MSNATSLVAKLEIHEEDGEYVLKNVRLRPGRGHGADGNADGLRPAHPMAQMTVPDFGEDHSFIEPETITILKGACIYKNGQWYC
jgi:hypothetical protein